MSAYDYLVLATGLRREYPIAQKSLTQRDYMREAEEHIEKIENSEDKTAYVIGGGMLINTG